jgi:hypothetical protein
LKKKVEEVIEDLKESKYIVETIKRDKERILNMVEKITEELRYSLFPIATSYQEDLQNHIKGQKEENKHMLKQLNDIRREYSLV